MLPSVQVASVSFCRAPQRPKPLWEFVTGPEAHPSPIPNPPLLPSVQVAFVSFCRAPQRPKPPGGVRHWTRSLSQPNPESPLCFLCFLLFKLPLFPSVGPATSHPRGTSSPDPIPVPAQTRIPFASFASFCSSCLCFLLSAPQRPTPRGSSSLDPMPVPAQPWIPLCFLCFLLFKLSLFPSVSPATSHAPAGVRRWTRCPYQPNPGSPFASFASFCSSCLCFLLSAPQRPTPPREFVAGPDARTSPTLDPPLLPLLPSVQVAFVSFCRPRNFPTPRGTSSPDPIPVPAQL